MERSKTRKDSERRKRKEVETGKETTRREEKIEVAEKHT